MTFTQPTPLSSSFHLQKYDSPLQLYDELAPYLCRREAEANIILPQLLKLRQHKLAKLAGSPATGWSPTNVSPSTLWIPDFWLVLRYNRAVQFVLSCTNGPLGPYPVFIWSAAEISKLSQTFISMSMEHLARELRTHLPSDMAKRVYSVFAPTSLTQSFASSWSSLTGKLPIEEPYYEATFAKVSQETLSSANRDRPAPYPFQLRQATPMDAAGIAHLCHEFAATSYPFILDMEGAFQEAQFLISQQCAFVCEVENQIVCLVAVTRSSGNVAAITKVVTHPLWGKQGWAKRLVRHVCQRLLSVENKKEVVLYVAHGNRPAESAYHSVGFGGLCGNSPVPGVDSHWLELGFEDTELGHW